MGKTRIRQSNQACNQEESQEWYSHIDLGLGLMIGNIPNMVWADNHSPPLSGLTSELGIAAAAIKPLWIWPFVFPLPQSLIRRFLSWCWPSSNESLDHIHRHCFLGHPTAVQLGLN